MTDLWTLRISQAQLDALDDALTYYEASDYGCGGNGALTPTEVEHVRAIRLLQEKVAATLGRLPS